MSSIYITKKGFFFFTKLTVLSIYLLAYPCYPFCMSGFLWIYLSVCTQFHIPWYSWQIRKIAGAHAPGMSGTFSQPPRVSDPDMHHGTCVTHVPWCMLGATNWTHNLTHSWLLSTTPCAIRVKLSITQLRIFCHHRTMCLELLLFILFDNYTFKIISRFRRGPNVNHIICANYIFQTPAIQFLQWFRCLQILTTRLLISAVYGCIGNVSIDT